MSAKCAVTNYDGSSRVVSVDTKWAVTNYDSSSGVVPVDAKWAVMNYDSSSGVVPVVAKWTVTNYDSSSGVVPVDAKWAVTNYDSSSGWSLLMQNGLSRTTKNRRGHLLFPSWSPPDQIIHSSNLLRDKRLLIDMAVIREMLLNKEINSVEWLGSKSQQADCLTKECASTEGLISALCGSKILC